MSKRRKTWWRSCSACKGNFDNALPQFPLRHFGARGDAGLTLRQTCLATSIAKRSQQIDGVDAEVVAAGKFIPANRRNVQFMGSRRQGVRPKIEVSRRRDAPRIEIMLPRYRLAVH